MKLGGLNTKFRVHYSPLYVDVPYRGATCRSHIYAEQIVLQERICALRPVLHNSSVRRHVKAAAFPRTLRGVRLLDYNSLFRPIRTGLLFWLLAPIRSPPRCPTCCFHAPFSSARFGPAGWPKWLSRITLSESGQYHSVTVGGDCGTMGFHISLSQRSSEFGQAPRGPLLFLWRPLFHGKPPPRQPSPSQVCAAGGKQQ